MRTFVKKIAVFLLVVSLITSLVLVLILKYRGQAVDPFYKRLTARHPGGLIIGTSRAAQSLEPDLLDKVDYNFSFTISDSPFDKDYLKLIKLYHPAEKQHDRVHVVTVDPWALFSYPGDLYEVNNPDFTGTLFPNIITIPVEYTFRYLDLSPGNLKSIFSDNSVYVNSKGRLVVPFDSLRTINNLEASLDARIKGYENLPAFQKGFLSRRRLGILDELISYLKQDGRVVLVRLPVHERMYALENIICKNFDECMKQVAEKHTVPYISLMDLRDSILFTDGNHIWNGHSKKISEALNSRIISAGNSHTK